MRYDSMTVARTPARGFQHAPHPAHGHHVQAAAQEPPLWKLTAEAVMLGLAGAIAMLATETMLFPDMMRVHSPKPYASMHSKLASAAAPYGHAPDAMRPFPHPTR